MFPQYLLFAALAVALPIVILLSVELWMLSTYTGIIGVDRFNSQYFTTIYRYRILGREQYLLFYHFLQSHFHDRPYPLPRDPSATLLTYGAFAISNGLYFTISNVILLSMMWVKRRGFLDRDLGMYLYYTFLLALSMAVVTPHDQLAYLLLLIGVVGSRQKSIAVGCVLILVSAIAGMLNRETEFLLASFLATMAIVSPASRARRYWIYLAVHIVPSILIYIGVRLLIPGKAGVIEDYTFGGVWAPESVLVLALLYAGAVVLAMRQYRNVRPALILIVMCSPYLFTIIAGSSFRELRITIPIYLCLVCLYLSLSQAQSVSGLTEGAELTVA